jgi:hypothetical protein
MRGGHRRSSGRGGATWRTRGKTAGKNKGGGRPGSDAWVLPEAGDGAGRAVAALSGCGRRGQRGGSLSHPV